MVTTATGGRRIRVALIQNFATDYNMPLFEALSRSDGLDLELFAVSRNPAYGQSTTLRSRQFPRGRIAAALFSRFGVSLPSRPLLGAVSAFHPECILIDGLSSAGTAVALLTGRFAPDAEVLWWSLGVVPGSRRSLRAVAGEWLQRWAVRRSAGVIAYGRHAAEYFEAGNPGGLIVVAPNTIDDTAIPFGDRDALAMEARRDLGVGDRPIVIFSGRLEPWKRVDVLIQAFAAARSTSRADPVLLVVGDGPQRDFLEACAAQAGVAGHVRFVGRVVEGISRFFFAAQFAVLPGSGGLAINHAFAHGVPVICGDADGTEQDLVVDDETGRLLRPVTIESLTGAMVALLEDPRKSAAMGEEARRRLTTRFSLRQCAEAIEGAIRAAVRGNDVAAPAPGPHEARC